MDAYDATSVALEGGEAAREEVMMMVGEDVVQEGAGEEMVDADTVQGQEDVESKADRAADGGDKACEQKKGK